MLEKCTGPACPKCGCQDSEIIEFPKSHDDEQQYFAGAKADAGLTWKNSPWFSTGRARCNHCRTQFRFRELPPELQFTDAPAPPQASPRKQTECPACGGKRYWKYTSKGPAQYRKCRDCGHTPSKEINARNGPIV